MKSSILKQFAVGAVIGILIAGLIIFILNFNLSPACAVLSVGILIIICWLVTFILMWQIKKRLKLDLEDEAEDENERIQYLKFVDGMFSAQTGVVLSVLILSIAIIFQLSVPIIAIAIATIIISNLVVTRLLKVNHDMNQDRDLPDINDPDYSRKLLQSSDEGEKYVILEGLYKTYSHTNLYLILAVVAATIYSLLSGTSQMFSVVLLMLIMFLMNGTYFVVIRQKA